MEQQKKWDWWWMNNWDKMIGVQWLNKMWFRKQKIKQYVKRWNLVIQFIDKSVFGFRLDEKYQATDIINHIIKHKSNIMKINLYGKDCWVNKKYISLMTINEAIVEVVK